MQASKPLDSFIVQVQPQQAAPTEDLKQVIVGALGVTGALVLAAVVSGAALGSLWILWRKWRRTYDADAPPSLGSVPISPEPTRPRSDPDQ
jgi:hypothetical protein